MGQTYSNRKPYTPLTQSQIESNDWHDYTRPLPPMPDLAAFQTLLNDDCTLMFRNDEASVIIFITNGDKKNTTLLMVNLGATQHAVTVKGGVAKIIEGLPFDLHRFRFMTYEDSDAVEAEVDKTMEQMGVPSEGTDEFLNAVLQHHSTNNHLN